MWLWLVLSIVPALATWLYVYVKLTLREFNRELTPAEDRSTDALKKIDMVDPDDPDTWLLFMGDAEIPK
jgi:hypothetical protein